MLKERIPAKPARALSAVTLLSTAVVLASALPASASVQPRTWYTKHVKSNVQSVTIYADPYSGNAYPDVLTTCQIFSTDRTDGSRYHIVFYPKGYAVDGWVTSDSHWVADGTC